MHPSTSQFTGIMPSFGLFSSLKLCWFSQNTSVSKISLHTAFSLETYSYKSFFNGSTSILDRIVCSYTLASIIVRAEIVMEYVNSDHNICTMELKMKSVIIFNKSDTKLSLSCYGILQVNPAYFPTRKSEEYHEKRLIPP